MQITLPVLLLGMVISQGAMAAGDGSAAVGGGVGGALGNIVGQQLVAPPGPPSVLVWAVLQVAHSARKKAVKPKPPSVAGLARQAAR